MRENQLPVHYTSAEETGRVRPAVDSGDAAVHISRAHITTVEARTADNYLADDLPNNVHITLAHFSAAGSASAVAVAPRALPRPRKYVAQSGTWLLASAVISVTTLYTICNPKWVPSCVAQTVKISTQLSADINRRASTPLGGTAVTDTVDRSAAQNDGSSSGAHRTVASDMDETGTQENPRRRTHNGNHTARSNASEMPKAAEVKTSQSEKGFMVPPPPATPCVLPPALDFFIVPPTQQQAAPQQQLQQAQAQNTQQLPTAASGETEATQSVALDAAEQELQAALNSSRRTVGEWTR